MSGARPGGASASRHRLVALAVPAVLSYLLNNGYRIVDQFWVQFLPGEQGANAQAAIATCTFVLVLNFAFFFLAAGGALPLVAQATGARDLARRDAIIRGAFGLGLAIALVLSVVGTLFSSEIPRALDLSGEVAALATAYLERVYLLVLPLALAPLVDSLFIGLGNTRIPLLLQGISITLTLVLDRVLILGWGPVEARGLAGAAEASAIARTVAVVVGVVLLRRVYRVRLRPDSFTGRRVLARGSGVAALVATGLPAAVSIVAYAVIYLFILRLVVVQLGRDVQAGLGIGFTVFEGFSFPFYVGIAMAGASLVGRAIGAGDEAEVRDVVREARRLGRIVGLAFFLVFTFASPVLVPLFSEDAGVAAAALLYVQTLAFSQYFVAAEAVNERVLLGAGRTRAIFYVSVPGNALRLPLAYWLAIGLGWHAAGVWWAINASTLIKSTAYFWIVERGKWLGVALRNARRG